MQISLRLFFVIIAYVCLAVFCFTQQTRMHVAILFTTTLLSAVWAVIIAVNSKKMRNFYASFAVVTLVFVFLATTSQSREFYFLPGVVAEFAQGPESFYHEWDSHENIPFPNDEMTQISAWRTEKYLREAQRRRTRFAVNSIFATVVGLCVSVIVPILLPKKEQGS